jgi:hypothetical protein
VNHLWHDEFVALCALFPSGELTEEEWALLQVHLAYCDSCRVAFDQYQQIATDVLPVIAASSTLEPDNKSVRASFSLGNAEQRLMTSLDSAPSDRRRLPWQVAAGAFATGLAIAVALAGLNLYRSKAGPAAQPSTAAQVGLLKPIGTPGDKANVSSELERSQQQIAELEQQLNEAKENWQQLNTSVTRMQQQVDAETAERKRANDERDHLRQQLVSVQSDSQSLQEKIALANSGVAQQAARTASLEYRLHDANVALEEKDRMLALDKEFLAHDREIRDLIGARDLYIADIYDVAQSGKTNKPFGRIFYTKDKSLVFYGYDLDKQSGLKQSVAFQAWGSGDDKQDVSLGLFYQDESHKRWVLRFNDTKTLARLNTVFVTAEPQGGSVKPTGKPLLMAYLQMQSNHP